MKLCQNCDNPLPINSRKDAIYCNSICKSSAFREKQKTTMPQEETIPMLQNLDFQTQYIIGDLKEKVSDFKAENKTLKSENEQLKKDNSEQKFALSFKDKEHSLALEGLEIKKKSSLNGFLETASSNEAIMNGVGVLMARLIGDESQQTISEGQPQYSGSVKVIADWLNKLSETDVIAFHKMVTVLAPKGQIPQHLDFFINHLKNEPQKTHSTDWETSDQEQYEQ